MGIYYGNELKGIRFIEGDEGKVIYENNYDHVMTKEEIEEEKKKKSIYATFKSYNRKSENNNANNKDKVYVIKEKCNRFSYRGKFEDYKEPEINIYEEKNKNAKNGIQLRCRLCKRSKDQKWKDLNREQHNKAAGRARNEARRWGIEIETVTISDLAKIRSIRLLNSNGSIG